MGALRVLPGLRGASPTVLIRQAELRDERDELRVVAEEALDVAVGVVHLARRIQTALAAGRLGLIGQYADEIERLGNHAAVRAKASAAIARVRQAEANGTCPDDHVLSREAGHGRAA